MPDKSDFGLIEGHETIRGGERVLIRQARPEDAALYRDFIRDVSADDLQLRFFGGVTELSATEIDRLSKLGQRQEMLSSRSTKTPVTCLGLCA
jgi:acetyltransferase